MRSLRWLICILILSAATAGGNRPAAHAQDLGAASAPDPLLDTLNGEFRGEYQKALTAVLAQPGPLILEEGDNLILVRNGERTSVAIKPAGYHELKAVAHIPLAIYVMLSFPFEESISPERRLELGHYRQLMNSAYQTLPQRHFTPTQLERQKMIFGVCFGFLQAIQDRGQVSRYGLEGFARETAPMLTANVNDATALEMHELYAVTATWKKEMTAAEWNSLHTVVIGPHMPRDEESSVQFFQRLLHETGEGKRIIYAESLWEEKDALKLLATHEVDEGAGAAFFGDPMRMHRDLLADAARAYLDSHPLP